MGLLTGPGVAYHVVPSLRCVNFKMRILAALGVLLFLAHPHAALAKAKSDKESQKHTTSAPAKAAPKAKPQKADAKPGKKSVALAAPAAAALAPSHSQKPALGSGPAIEALRLADNGKWPQAKQLAETSGNKLALKLVRWLEAAQPNSAVPFKEIADLVAENPDWPQRNVVQRRAEEAIGLATPNEHILAWFDANKPISADGGMAYGGALLAAGRGDEARDVLRQTWINKDFGVIQERSFLAKYREILTSDDHLARMKRLLWEEQTQAAERLMLFLEGPGRNLAHARLMLIRGLGTPAQALESVPETMRQDPGLLFDCVRWYRRKDMNDEAIRIAKSTPDDLERPDIWWNERTILARRALQMGYVSDAYEIAGKHKQNDGANYAEAEWMAGWIALRFLSEKETALKHFTQMADKVQSAPGKARAAYWQGRAAEALGMKEIAQAAYKQAALFPTSYYGQLASEQLGPDQGWLLPPDPVPTDEDKARFAKNEIAQAIDLMVMAGTPALARPFLMRLLENADTPGMKALAVGKAEMLGRIDLTVSMARRADRAGISLFEAGWPVPPYAVPEIGPEKALILALIRQESGFHVEAISSVGARGLMQLMPATAKKLAQNMKIKYNPGSLTSDPAYNIRMGTTYLAGLLDDFKGSYIMALAGYNAGPHRVTKWVREYGDPREADVDAVDWVEMIPFSETRGYVQRVMESVQIYRKRLGSQSSTVALKTDLKRKLVD